MLKSSVVVVALIGAIFVALYMVLGGKAEDAKLAPNDHGIALTSTPSLQDNTSKVGARIDDRGQSNTRGSVSFSDEGSSYLDANDSYRIRLWNESRGYYDESDRLEYQAYGKSTLSNLAVSGDVRAIHALAANAVMEGKPEDAHFLYRDAAIHGSTSALMEATWLLETEYLDADSEEKRAELIVEIMALLEVGVMRGDVVNATRNISSLKRRHNFDISDNQSLEIDRRAHKLYRSLEEERIQLGLGEFDNSVDVEVKKLSEMMD